MASIPQIIDPTRLSREAQHLLALAGANSLDQLVVKQGLTPEARDLLESLTFRNVLASPYNDQVMAHLVVCGLWLLHDALDDAHPICQTYEEGAGAPTASFWHAHLHRREGDFSNGKYWYRRAGEHPALTTLAQHALPIVNAAPADKLLFKITSRGFDTSAFVDLCEIVESGQAPQLHDTAVALQRLEWRVLMAHTIEKA